MNAVILIFACFSTAAFFAQAGPMKRLILHDDQSVSEAIHSLETTVAILNASLNQAMTGIAVLNASLNHAVTELRNAVHTERCQVGTVSFHDLKCATGQGSCHEDVNIAFNPTFTKPPSVVYGLRKLDVDGTHNLRVNTGVSHVTTSHATLTVFTWADSILYVTSLSWMACPSH